MIPTQAIKGWIDYEVKEGLFVITKVDYDARGKTVETVFENAQGDQVSNRYNLDNQFGNYAWNKLVTAATGKSGDGGVTVEQMLGKFILVDIEASDPARHAEGTVFYNVKRTVGTDRTFETEAPEEFGGPTLDISEDDFPF